MLDTCLHGHKCIGTALVHQKDTGEGDAVGSGNRTPSKKTSRAPTWPLSTTILGLLLWKIYTCGMKHGKGVRFFYTRTLGHECPILRHVISSTLNLERECP